ncbi:type I phosphomannose isomerase catalytic subunit [Flavobacterium cyclinae]|uniref:type I phosphomannose isomerase catalytic subunit n=1 Tax=Flavobacterium cyclinae TaxID=2895947 RepID=UPI001E4C95E7|nr:type I phosphomannose isomerase catalytic subunit [Flavobacterium cyclinae]UGS20522.1 class I mannose-6-phosphate isomerase [Flavobacterium cyclinae]
MKFYPLTFTPILKDRIWGGSKLKTYLNKPIVSETTGESWEISTVPGEISIVNTGVFKGKNINEIIDLYPEEILGKSVIARFGKQFPLLFKFIDAKEDLSIQLHPNDELARERHNSFGKTEMWYVMQSDESARLVVGFKKDSNQQEYLAHLENKNLIDLLNEYPVSKGDVFFLETGTIHAIGAGVVVAEIQQTSDVTYRIYDWDRVDINGNGRELHTELALDAINYHTTPSKIDYKEEANKSTTIVDCTYFVTNIIALQETFIWKRTKQAFTVFMCTNGQFEMIVNGEIVSYRMGDTILIPACMENLTFRGKATLLEISI